MNFPTISLKNTKTIQRIVRRIRRDAALRSDVFRRIANKPNLQTKIFARLAKDLDLQHAIVSELVETPQFRRKILKIAGISLS
jgi:hypothetical protein